MIPPEPFNPDDLILLAASGARAMTPAELGRVLAYVANAGFDLEAQERAGGRLAGLRWQGRMLRGRDRLPPAEVHYLRHVQHGQGWPPGTSLSAYLDSLRTVVLDLSSGVLTSQFEGRWQLTIVRRSGLLAGPEGGVWVLVDYRVATGHWVTGYQPDAGLHILEDPGRTNRRWLRLPT